MNIALFTGVLRDAPFEHVAKTAAEIGYDALELRALSHLKPDSSIERVKEVRRIADHYGLAIPVIYSNINGQYANSTEQEAEGKLELLKRYADWAAIVGARMVCHGPGGPSPHEAAQEHFDKASYWLDRAAAILSDSGVKLVLEIHHKSLVETVDSTLRLLDTIGRPDVGAILDPGNMAIAGEDYGEEAVRRLGDRLFHVHAKDVWFYTDPQDEAKGYAGRQYRVELMGKGHVDHAPAYLALLQSGYEGYVSLEAQVAGVEPERIARHEYEQARRTLQRLHVDKNAFRGGAIK